LRLDHCLAKLTQLGALAGRSRAETPGRGAARIAGPDLGAFPDFEGALAKNGIGRLLPVLPFGANTVKKMQQTALLDGLMESIQRTLGVNLAVAGPEATQKLQSAIGKMKVPALRLRPEEYGEAMRLARAAPAIAALRNVGVDPLDPGAGHALGNWLRAPDTQALLSDLRGIPLNGSTVNGVAKLAGISEAANRIQPKLPDGRVAVAAPQRSAPSGNRGSAPSRVPTLEARVPEFKALQLPDLRQVAAVSGEFGALKAIEQSLGIDPRHPGIGRTITDAMGRLKASGICQAAEGAGFEPLHHDALERLERFEVSRHSIRETAGVDLLDPHAAKKLARSVEGMRSAARVASAAPAPSTTLIDWLSRLAALGALAEAIGWGRRR